MVIAGIPGRIMILQNLAKAIREQNYYAVFLEFVIVIAGVVIGFQISAWNEAREDRAAEQLFLSRLASDFEHIIAIEEEYMTTVDAARTGGTSFLQQVSAGRAPTEISDICASMNPARAFRPPPAASPTYVQLVSNGDMGLIRNEGLRAALANFETARHRHFLGYQSSLDTSLALSRAFWNAVDICDAALLGENAAFGDDVRRRIAEAEFAGALSGLVTQHENSFRQHATTLAEARAVLELIAAEQAR